MSDLIGWLLLAAVGAVLLLQLWALRQRSGTPGGAVLRELELAAREQEKLETRLREELVRNRDEAGKGTAQLRTELARVLQEQQKGITDNLDRIRQQGTDSSKVQREELAAQLALLAHSNEEKLEAVRQTVETKLTQLQTDNAGKLEQMRMTVDEKLQSTPTGTGCKRCWQRFSAQRIAALRSLLYNQRRRNCGNRRRARLPRPVINQLQPGSCQPTAKGAGTL